MSDGGHGKDLFLLDQRLLRLRACGDGEPPKERDKEPWEAAPRATVKDSAGKDVVGLVERALSDTPDRRVALVCDAGLGKTTNARWLQAQLCRRGSRVLPLLLRLDSTYAQDLLDEEHATPLSLLRSLATEIDRKDVDRNERHLRKLHAEGRVTLLIDGLDHAMFQMRHLPAKLAKILTAWATCPVWIFGRPNAFILAWEGVFSDPAWTFLRVAGLDRPEIRFYLREQVEPDSKDRIGLDWYAHLPEEGRELLAIPRFLHLVAGVLRKEIAAAKASGGDRLAAVEKLDLRTRADVYRLAYFEPGEFIPPSKRVADKDDLRNRRGLIAQGLEVRHEFGDGTWQYLGLEIREEPSSKNHARRIKYTADLLGAIAFEMYANPDKYTAKKTSAKNQPLQPNVAGIPESKIGAFQKAVRSRLVAADLFLEGSIIGNTFDILGDNNRTVDWLMFRELGGHGLAWHDRTVQAFFAAYWAMNYATPAELHEMDRWKVVLDGKEERLKGFDEFWQFAAEMPDGSIYDADMANWFTTFEPSYTPPAELPGDDEAMVQWHRRMIYHSYVRMEQRSLEAIERWRALWLKLKVGKGTREQQAVYDTIIFKNCPPTMVADTYLMGSPEDEADRDDDKIQHEVMVKPFRMQDFQVTNAQYELFDPKHRKLRDEVSDKDGQPVIHVSFWDAWCFAKWTENRLPKEEEWEYACRAGGRTPYSFGSALNGTQANCDGSYPYGTEEEGPYLERTVEKSERPPKTNYESNVWGLWHMHGNVLEWCDSRTEPGDIVRVLCGGGWDYYARLCRSAFRSGDGPGDRYRDVGFRLAAVPVGAKQDRSVGDAAARVLES